MAKDGCIVPRLLPNGCFPQWSECCAMAAMSRGLSQQCLEFLVIFVNLPRRRMVVTCCHTKPWLSKKTGRMFRNFSCTQVGYKPCLLRDCYFEFCSRHFLQSLMCMYCDEFPQSLQTTKMACSRQACRNSIFPTAAMSRFQPCIGQTFPRSSPEAAGLQLTSAVSRMCLEVLRYCCQAA